MEIDDIGILRESHEKLRDGTADVTDHNTRDQKSRHMTHCARNHKYKGRGHHGAGKGRQDQSPRRGSPETPDEKDHDDGDTHLGAGGNTQDKGSRDGIAEEGLQKETGEGQSPSQNGRLQNARHTDLPDDADLICFPLPQKKDPENPSDRDADAARIDIQNDHCQKGRCERGKHHCIACPPKCLRMRVFRPL